MRKPRIERQHTVFHATHRNTLSGQSPNRTNGTRQDPLPTLQNQGNTTRIDNRRDVRIAETDEAIQPGNRRPASDEDVHGTERREGPYHTVSDRGAGGPSTPTLSERPLVIHQVITQTLLPLQRIRSRSAGSRSGTPSQTVYQSAIEDGNQQREQILLRDIHHTEGKDRKKVWTKTKGYSMTDRKGNRPPPPFLPFFPPRHPPKTNDGHQGRAGVPPSTEATGRKIQNFKFLISNFLISLGGDTTGHPGRRGHDPRKKGCGGWKFFRAE
jgi:hypothetical protein